MYNLSLDFDKLPIFSIWTCTYVWKKNYINTCSHLSNLRSWLLSVVTTSSAMPRCHAELEFLVYGLRFARFHFRTISLPIPNLSKGNQSLPEPWCHARVHAFRCTQRWKCKPPPLHNNWATTLYDSCTQRDVLRLPSILPPPPPILESKPPLAIDNLGWAISLRKLNRDLEGFVNNWRPNPFHTFTRRLFCYYEEVLNCPALCSTKSNCHQQFNWNNLTHTRIPLQLFAQFLEEPVTFGNHGSSVHVLRPSTSLGQIVIYLLSTAATASISVIYAPVICIHCSPTYGDGRG